MKLLDLFCCAGGASMGYYQAGFRVVGVDIEPQPNYPFTFRQADALDLDLEFLLGFDAIHASPPCQAYSPLARRHAERDYPDLVGDVRAMLRATGRPFVIENVPGAPLHRPIGLCGSMFGLGINGRHLQRHRMFELHGFTVIEPPRCAHTRQAIGVYGDGVGEAKYGPIDMSHRAGYQGTAAERQEAMGISWMTGRELAEAIPPAYTEWIGHQLHDHLEARRAAV